MEESSRLILTGLSSSSGNHSSMTFQQRKKPKTTFDSSYNIWQVIRLAIPKPLLLGPGKVHRQ